MCFVIAHHAFCYGCSCILLRFFMRLGSHLANWPSIAFGCPSCQLALPCPWSPNLGQSLGVFCYDSSCVWVPMLRTHLALRLGRPYCELALRCARAPNLGEDVLKNLPPSQNWFLSILWLLFLPSAPFVWSFSLRLFVRFVTALPAFRYGRSCVPLRHLLRAFGRPSCQLALHCGWVPLLPTRLAEPLVAQPWPGSSCVSLWLFVRLGAHVAKSPCVAFGCPSCELALRCVRVPNLGEAVLKNLPPSQNWFLSVLRLVFFPSAPFVWSFSLRLFVRFVTAVRAFRYGSSCVSLRPFVRSVTALRALPLRPFVRSVTALRAFRYGRLGAHLANWPCIAFGCPSCQLALPCVAFGRTSCELALRCIRAPNLGEAVLKNLYLQAKIGSYPSSGSSFCLVLPLCGRFRYGSSCISLRPFVRSHCVWAAHLA
jgi:hypothetical protein